MTSAATVSIETGITADELVGMARFVYAAFGETWNEADEPVDRLITPLDRVVVARVDGELAGSGFAFPAALMVPGGELPCAAVSGVGVRPDRRRHGVLTALMTRLLEQAHELRAPVAALWASEAAIYGRYGFGMATERVGVTVPRRAAMSRVPPGDVDLRMVEVDDTLATTLGAVHDAAAVPGFLRRDATLWTLRLHFPEHQRRGATTPLRCLLAGDPANPTGYALWAVKASWGDSGPDGRVELVELLARTPAAAAALWTFLADVDLTTAVHAGNIAPDSPVLTLLANPRTADIRSSDGLWIRLVDLPAALTARSWAQAVDVVLDVHDPTCRWNEGRWHLTGDTDGALCERTLDNADLGLLAADLGAIYLGGTTLTALAGAGRVEEYRAGAVGELSRAARGDIEPWSPLVF